MKCKSDSWKLSQASQTMSNKHLSRNQNQNQNQDNATEEEIDVSSVDVHNRQSVLDLFEDKLEVKVTNISMSLSMSSISGLTDLTEDEIIPRPIPLQVCQILILFILPLYSYIFIIFFLIADIFGEYILAFKRRSSSE